VVESLYGLSVGECVERFGLDLGVSKAGEGIVNVIMVGSYRNRGY
jgi:hypothetical protein